ncbi:MAG: T9SS type A sorting domain-containing protein, partial [Flavobacteriales bacterium]
ELTVALEVQTVEAECGGSIIRTWSVSDDCGNTTSLTQTITLVDTTAPIITCPADVQEECDSNPDYGMATAEDNCNAVTITSEDSVTGDDCETVITRTWTATDACGNMSECVQLITLVDTTDPILLIPADLAHECDEMPVYGEATATDACNEVTVTFEDVTTGDDCETVITRTWTATDACGNNISDVQTITIVDTTAPILSIPADLTHECDEQPDYGMATAEDNCNEVTVTSSDVITGDVCETVVTRTWTATDACGNTTSDIQTITIVDTTAPVLFGLPADAAVECDAIPEPAEVTATDNCDETLEVEFTEITEPSGCELIITRTWRATDECANTSLGVQTLIVVDTTAPEISEAPADVTVECSTIPEPVELTATDNCDDNVEITYSEVSSDGCPYTITRTWTATDDCGNQDSTIQVITVIDEEFPMFVDFQVEIDVNCEEIDDYVMIEATDNCDADVEVTFVDLNFSGGCFGVIQRTWYAEDNCGNITQAVQFIRQVDEVDPVLFGVPADITLECGDDIPAPAADVTAADNCATDLTVVFEEVQSNDFCPYTITRTWTVQDECGNIVDGVQVITVEVETPDFVEIASFPNPASDEFTVQFSIPTDKDVDACIFDALGRAVTPVFKGQADGHRLYEFNISASNWESGMYVLSLLVGDEVHHHKILINTTK